MKLCIATSRPIGARCAEIARELGYTLSGMENCDIFISVLYDTLLSKEYIDSRPCFNFHPGILPWYRGAGAYSWAIINGEMEAGVTLHEIDRDIDHGDVIDIQRFPILAGDTAESLFRKAEETIEFMFRRWIAFLIAGNYRVVSQVEGRIYYRKDLERAKDLTRMVRAFTFEGKEHAYYFNAQGEKIYLKL